ncbi:hypothetical protein CLV92_108141 [Kineococcus xinjiangensis]|uniref:Uncharacterized protein n=1 Tax=Kineococcus xinjiangensis TaxID=512762 RepID=A0A2S6IJ47_9ACTN|nr:hypothetical protein [Kineococcus xinjiangensis]PPK94239.1 hypothetical protein CLV92_108141 [Kineococcus xinjiangensis]
MSVLLEQPTRVTATRWWLVLVPAATWSLAYLGLGLAWSLGAGGNPADPAVDPAVRELSLLGLLTPAGGAALLAGLGALGVLLTAALLLGRPGGGRAGWAYRAAAALAGALGVVLVVLLPDYRLLAAVGYTPIVGVLRLVGAAPAGVQVWPWPVVNMVLLSTAGLAWQAVAVLAARRAAGACQVCGRDGAAGSWRSPERAARWGRWAVAVAVAVPVGYAVTRFAWALGVPLGVSQELLDELGSGVWAGAGLAAMAVGGAVLTLGLVQRWGEFFPRWMPRVGGRRVPVALAVVPALAVSGVVASAGLMFVRVTAAGEFAAQFPGDGGNVAAWLPELFWPLWAVALAVAAYAYWLRRRTACRRCGRG